MLIECWSGGGQEGGCLYYDWLGRLAPLIHRLDAETSMKKKEASVEAVAAVAISR